MEHVTLDLLYKEIRHLHNDVEFLKSAMIPVEKVSEEERTELRKIAKEMDAGKKYSSKEVLGV